jgi:iron(III) transport system ATP-binding protein
VTDAATHTGAAAVASQSRTGRSALEVKDLTKRFVSARRGDGPVTAVDAVTFEVEPGRLTTLLGPSGCGKTTILRCVAGLERADAGTIAIGDRVLFSSAGGVDVRPERRGLGLVFQSYALWPHMNVRETVAFPLEARPRAARPPPREIRERVDRVLSTVQLDLLADRSPSQLSGGQQQRLALGRALVTEPPLLLMDEPLSNLDARMRDDMRLELKRLQRDLGVTVLHVTHDQAEALAMSNAVAVMRDGRIEQVGRPRDIYERPRSRFVADFVGASNLLRGVVQGSDADDATVVSTPIGPLACAGEAELPRGSDVLVSVRSEQATLEPGSAAEDKPRANTFSARVSARAFRGDAIDHVVLVGDVELRARTPPTVSIPPGTEAILTLPKAACWLVPEGD